MKVETPQRVRHSYVQSLSASPEQVFPLLCPVRESEWVPGWSPLRVISNSGVAEPDCIFITEAAPQDATWVTTRHEPDRGILQMFKITPDHTVCRIDITLRPHGKESTQAEVSYEYTAIGPAGEAFLKEFTEAWYNNFMTDWEHALNHYLTTGKITGSD